MKLLTALNALCADWTDANMGILQKCTASYHNDGAGRHVNILYGDYEKTFPLARIDGPQRVELGAHRTRTLTLDRLIKCDNPSAFPALRQIEVYGK